MNSNLAKFPIQACQNCGSLTKYVETIIDDEFIWDEVRGTYVPNGYTDDFEHTGNDRCAECDENWTGL